MKIFFKTSLLFVLSALIFYYSALSGNHQTPQPFLRFLFGFLLCGMISIVLFLNEITTSIVTKIQKASKKKKELIIGIFFVFVGVLLLMDAVYYKNNLCSQEGFDFFQILMRFFVKFGILMILIGLLAILYHYEKINASFKEGALVIFFAVCAFDHNNFSELVADFSIENIMFFITDIFIALTALSLSQNLRSSKKQKDNLFAIIIELH